MTLRVALIGGGRIADLHASAYRRASRAGKHVSVQKPMAVSLEDCDAMIAACRAAGVTLKVFENFVFHEPYRRAKALLEAGAIGRPLAARYRIGAGWGGWKTPLRSWLWRLREAERGYGPTVFDDGWHKLSLAIELFGPVIEVSGFIGRTFGLVDSPAMLGWRHESGALGHLDASLTPGLRVETKYYPADERVEIAGELGEIRVDGCTGRTEPGPALTVEREGRVEAHTGLAEDWQCSFDACVQDFIDAALDKRPPHLTGERGREVHAFALACLRAGRGETVKLDAPWRAPC